jgi:hypothetical protein
MLRCNTPRCVAARLRCVCDMAAGGTVRCHALTATDAMAAGCDGVVRSAAVFDLCGDCDNDSNRCRDCGWVRTHRCSAAGLWVWLCTGGVPFPIPVGCSNVPNGGKNLDYCGTQ